MPCEFFSRFKLILHAYDSAYCGVAVHGLFSPLLSPVSLLGYEVGVWSLLAIFTFPISFLKQCVCAAACGGMQEHCSPGHGAKG